MKRAVGIILFFAVMGYLVGCATHRSFVLFDDKTVIKNGTIAVISTDGSDATLRLAEALTKELKQRSTFKVVSQVKVGLRVGDYPVTIKEGQPEDPAKPVWLGKGEKAKVDAMQAKLKVHYLYVVWTGFSRTGNSDNYEVRMNGNVIEYPKGRVIGYSHLTGTSQKRKGKDISQMMKDSAARMAVEFASAAKAEKPGKAGSAGAGTP